MGRYKGKRLKQNTGIFGSAAVARRDEEPNAAATAVDTLPAQSAAVPRSEEEPSAAEPAAYTLPAQPAAIPRLEEEPSTAEPAAVPRHDEGPNAAEAAVDAPSTQSAAVPRLEAEPNAAETAADTPSAQSAAVPRLEEDPNAAEPAVDAPSAQPAAVPWLDEDPNATESAAGVSARIADFVLRLKKHRRFLIGLAIYAAVLLAVSGVLQIRLWQFLKGSQAEMDREAAELAAQQAYEKALYRAPQMAFETWLSGRTADFWTDLWYDKASSGLDARESVRKYMAEHFAPDAMEACKAVGFTDEAPVYVLKSGEDSLARITMTGSELNWRVAEVELLIEGTHSVSITVADSCHVYCNGNEMGEEYAQAAESRFSYGPLEKRLKEAVTWVNYSTEGLLLEPVLTVEPPEGYGAIQTADGDYLLGLAGDTSAYTNRAVGFVKAYLYYYMSGQRSTRTNMNNVLSYLTAGTQAYRDISDTYSGVYWSVSYSNIDTSNTAAGDVLVWADNCFSVDVIYNADCTWEGEHVDYADATMRVYFLQAGQGYIISNFESI